MHVEKARERERERERRKGLGDCKRECGTPRIDSFF